MLILRRHWVAGGKCDVTLTPALVDIYKRANEQSVSSFTITGTQSGTIIAESLTNGNNVPYFTINRNSFSPGTTTVTVTGIAFEEGYPTNIGRIIIKCRGGGKQIIDVDYADCDLDVSIDNLIFDDEHGTVTFSITSTTGGTINDSHITEIQTGETISSGTLFIENYDENNGYDIVVDYYRAGASSLAFPEAWHETETIHLDENIPDSGHIHAASYNIDPSLPYSVTPGRESDTVDYQNDNIVYNVTGSTSPVMAPAVDISPKTFNAGTTTITATLNENASAGDLGYLVISNSCGATTNVNVSYITNQLSISPITINLDANGTAQNVTISSSILSGTITADSGIIISANSFNSGSTTIQVSAAPNSDTNSKNLGVITATDSQGNTVTCSVTQAAASVTPAQYPEGEELIGAGFYGGNVLSTNVIGSISYDDNNKENIANLRLDYQVAFTYLGDETPVRKIRLNASSKPNTLTLSLYITDSNTATTGYDGSSSDITALGTKLAEVPLTFVSGEYYTTPVDNLLTPITGATNANTQQVTMDQQGDILNGTWTTLFSFTMPTNVLNALTSGNNIVGVVDNHRTVPGMLTYNNSNSIGGAVGGIFSYDILE